MSAITATEMRLLDSFAEMGDGHVLDFNNRTFAEFFRDYVGIDIYDDTYSEAGNSKGKRLRTFFRTAQSRAVAAAITALWEYREAKRISEGVEDAIPNCRKRLSQIVERLGGNALPSHDPTTPSAEPLQAPASKGPTTVQRQVLQEQFIALSRMEPQSRGFAFECFLTDFFAAWGLDPRGSFRNAGEQIDGSFSHENADYLLEAKWQKAPTGAADLHALQGKLSERVNWARGLFISHSGYSSQALDAFTSRQIILMDGQDIADTLYRDLHLDEVLRKKVRHAVDRKQAFARVRVLFNC